MEIIKIYNIGYISFGTDKVVTGSIKYIQNFAISSPWEEIISIDRNHVMGVLDQLVLNYLFSVLSVFVFLIVDVTSWGNLLHYPEYVRSVRPQWNLSNLIEMSSSSHYRFVSHVDKDQQKQQVEQPDSYLDRDSRSLMNTILQLRRSLRVI